MNKYLNPDLPVVVITEGIVNYFDIETMKTIWRRISDLLNNFKKGIYLCDNMPERINNK